MSTEKAASQLAMSISSTVWQKLRSSKLIQDAWKLLALQFGGRVVAFFASAYAMRSLGPEQLGIGAFVISVAVQGAVLGDLGLDISGVRAVGVHPDRRNEIITLVLGIRLRAAFVLSILLLIGVWFFRPIASTTLWIMAAPLLMFTVLSPQWIFQGIERMPVFNAIQLAQTIGTALLYIGLFRPGSRAELYVMVAVVSQALGWGWSYYWIRHQIHIDWFSFDWRQAWKMIRSSSYAFAIVLTIFVYAGMQIPLITFLRSPEEAGIYRASQTVSGAILPILSMLLLLLYPRLISWKNRSDEEFIKKATITIAVLFLMALLLDLGAVIVLPVVFSKLLGSQFQAGALPSALLCIAIGFILLGAVPSWGLLAYGLDKRQLLVTLTAAVISLTLNILLIPRFGIVVAAGVKALTELVIFVLSAFSLFSFLRSRRNTEYNAQG
jgi:O-antigen/teichoic acid export membrane protein